MTRGIAVMVGSMLVLATATSALAQGRGRGGAPPCTTVACDVQGDWARGYALLIGVAEAMPEDKYSAKPTPAQQSFGERLMHVAGTCVSCGECERVCPMGIPLMKLNEKMADDLRELFDFVAGVDLDKALPFRTYRLEDPDDFIK